MATISVKTWMGPTKKRKHRSTRRKDLQLRQVGDAIPGNITFATFGRTTRRRVISIDPDNGVFIAFIDQGWGGKNIYLPRRIAFSMLLSLIKQGKFP